MEKEFRQNVTFKPKIDENSKKLYSDYRRKILVTESHESSEAIRGDKSKGKEINDFVNFNTNY